MKLNKTTGTNDVLAVGGNIVYGGTLSLTNISGNLAANDQIQIIQRHDLQRFIHDSASDTRSGTR